MSDASSSVSTNPATTLTFTGFVGIGEPLSDANVSIVDVTDEANPVVLATASTDIAGIFRTTIAAQSSDAKILFVASSGSYLDPLTFQSVSNRNHILEGVWKYKYLTQLENIDVTPFSTLASAFYKCLSQNDALAADPLDYSLASFNSLFDVNLNLDYDTYLNTAESEPNASLYSLYNVAFARMAKEKRATSALDLVSDFSNQLEEGCDLLGPTSKFNGSYAYHTESFRRDYLSALKNLRLEGAFTTWAESLDIDATVEEIRSASNLLFQFEEYPE